MMPCLVAANGEIYLSASRVEQSTDVCRSGMAQVSLSWEFKLGGTTGRRVRDGDMLHLQLRKTTYPYEVLVESVPTEPSLLVAPMRSANASVAWPLPNWQQLLTSGLNGQKVNVPTLLWLEKVNDTEVNSGPTRDVAASPVLPTYCCSDGAVNCACSAGGTCKSASLKCSNDTCVPKDLRYGGYECKTFDSVPVPNYAPGCSCSPNATLGAAQRCALTTHGTTCDSSVSICVVADTCAGRDGTIGCACRTAAIGVRPCALTELVPIVAMVPKALLPNECNPTTSICEPVPPCSAVQNASIAACSTTADCQSCECRAALLSCLNKLFCIEARAAAAPVYAACTAANCAECGRLAEPCTKIANEVGAECNASVATREELNSLALASMIGAKTELTTKLCSALRDARLCYGRVLTRHPTCVRPFAMQATRLMDVGSLYVVEGSFPACESSLAAKFAAISCDFCDPVPGLAVPGAPPAVTAPSGSDRSSAATLAQASWLGIVCSLVLLVLCVN
jgi:hypothetical protein